MLNRQKVLLALLLGTPRPLGRTSFVKMVFLLREEASLAAEIPFYEFVPYRYGPFSFTLYRELGRLGQDGLVSIEDKTIALEEHQRETAETISKQLPEGVRDRIAQLLGRFGMVAPREILNYVYAKYPWYASRSEIAPRPETPPIAKAPPGVYTIGYEQRTVDGLLGALLRAGMSGILDVRANPVSRRYGFAGSTLSRLAGDVRLDYTHFPSLGISGSERRDLDTPGALDRLLDRYEREMLPAQETETGRAAQVLQSEPVALLCREADPAHCHRGRLAKALSERTGLPVTHL